MLGFLYGRLIIGVVVRMNMMVRLLHCFGISVSRLGICKN